MIDEYGKPLEFCFFLFCADDPISCQPLVPGSLIAEEFPSGPVCAKLPLLFTSEASALPLFVRVDARLFCASSGEGLEAVGMHQPLLCELSNKFDVDGTPSARGLAGSEANCVAGIVNALAHAVDPSEAERFIECLVVSDAGFA